MSFLAAAFLAGLAALAVPWWLHRREQRNQRQRPVSSLLLMHPSEEPEQARKVLRYPWLLALRMLLLAVLVLAFAQPVLERAFTPPAAAADALPRIIALDTSLSMAASFAEARRRAHGAIDALPPGGRAAVVSAADQIAVMAPLTGDRGTLHRAVDAARPGYGRLAFDGLVGRLTALSGTMVDGAVEVHLVSDFQASAMPEQFNGLLSGAGGPVALRGSNPDRKNWLIGGMNVEDRVAVTVRGIETPERRLEVVLANAAGELGRRGVVVPAGGSATVSFPLPEHDSGTGDGWLQARIAGGDALAADDVAFQVLRRGEAVPLPVITSPGAGAQLEYLTAAVSAAASRFRPGDPVESGPVAVLVDPGGLAGDRVRLLERHLDGGGAVLMTVGPATRRAGRLPLMDIPVDGGPMADEPRGVVAADRSHPALARFAGWHEVTVSRHLTAGDGSGGRVLLALDDGSPLLVEHRLAGGRMLVLMTALDPSWSTLVTQPAFVAFVADALGYLAEDALPDAAVAGRPVSIPAANVQLFDAHGNRMLGLGETVGRPTVPLEEPGVYTLRTPSRERLLAVNPDGRESDLRPAPGALLERWHSASLAIQTPAAPAGLPDDPVRTLALAPWLLGLLALLAVLEPLAANGASNRSRGGVAS